MRQIAAGLFKAKCLALMDDVQKKHETIIITKNGKPVAQLVPVEKEVDEIFGFYHGKGTIPGDVLVPVAPLKDWESVA